MTAFHAFIKWDQILLWTSQKKEEIQKVKSLYCYSWIWMHFVIIIIIIIITIFCFSFCYCGSDDTIFSKFSFSKIAAIQEKNSCMCKGRFSPKKTIDKLVK